MGRTVKGGLFLRFLVSFSLVIIVSALIIVFSIRVSTRNQYTRIVNQYDIQRAEELAVVFSSLYLQSGGWETVAPLLAPPGDWERGRGRGRMRGPGPHKDDPGRMYVRMLGQRFRIVLTDKNHRVVADSFGEFTGQVIQEHRERKSAAVEADGQVVGYVLVGTMIQPVLSTVDQNFLRSANRGVFLAALAGLVLSFLVTLIFFRRVTAPVRNLSAASKTIAGGDYSVIVEERGDDELSDLLKNFNNMTRALKSSDEWKKQLIADAAHELRTPVSLIKANLEMMLEGVYPMDRQQLSSIYNETDKLSRLIGELQVLSSADAEPDLAVKDLLSVPSLLDKSMPLFTLAAREKGVTIAVEGTEDVPAIEGDEVKLSQVFSNIFANALRYSPENGQITIILSADSEGVTVSFTDQGPGIPKQELERVFDRFYKVDQSRNRQEGEGSGLGLAISREIIRVHSGRIWAESDGSSGTTVSVSLPHPPR